MNVIERLYAEPIACDEKTSLRFIPDRIGEHPAKMFNYIAAVSLVECKDRLGVGCGGEFDAIGSKLLSALPMVVDLAVKDYRRIAASHRLNAARDIDDAQTPMPKPYIPVNVHSRIVRPAMFQYITHSDEQPLIDPSLTQSNAVYSTHNR